MMQKIRAYAESHEKEYETFRYLVAGGLTFLLSQVVFSTFCMAVSVDHTIDGATQAQANAAQVTSWIVAVLFAFWVNRRMVFLRKGGETRDILRELGQFILGRLVSGLVFEIGLFNLLAFLGVGNLVNKLIGQVLVIIFNYVVSKFWIFAKKPEPPQGSEACPAAEGDFPASPEPTKE